MGIFKSLLRSMLGEYGLVGRAIADKIDPNGAPFDERTTYVCEETPGTPPTLSLPQAFAPGPIHEPIREVTYQVLTNNSYWRTVGFGMNVSTAVAEGLNRLKGEYPDLPVRAIDKITLALIDIRT